MDSIKVWTAKVVILSLVSIVLITALQMASGLDIDYGSQQISQTIVGNITALLIVQLLCVLYEKTIKFRVEKLWKYSLAGFLIESSLYTCVIMLFLLNQVSYTLQGYGSVLASIYIFIAYSLTFIWLTEEKLDSFLHNTVVIFLTWFAAGGISAGVLAIGVGIALLVFGIQLFENPLVMLGTWIITGGLVASLSVVGRRQKLGRVGRQVTMYSNLLSRLDRKQSFLLDSILHDENHVATLNPLEAREQIEYNVPWLLASLSMTVFMTVASIRGILGPPVNVNPLDFVMFLGIVGFLLHSTYQVMNETHRTYRGYQEWRRVWSDFWDLVKLFSMSKDAAAMEYTHRIADKSLSELSQYPETLDEKLEELLEIYEWNEKVPTDLEDQRVMFVNVILYGQLKDRLAEPSPNAELLENELGLLEKAKSILDNTRSLGSQNIRQDLAIGALYASVYDDFGIPAEMFMDVMPLLTRDRKHEPEIFSQCIEQLVALEDTPKRIIPDSLKWLPAIFPIALWLATVLFT